MGGQTNMKRRLPKSITQKDRERIKNESIQDIIPIKYSKDVEEGKRKVVFTLPPKTA